MSIHATEVGKGERFEFGKNWQRFLESLDEQRIQAAVESLRALLGVDRLDGKKFLDIGSGSGLFSLAARRLGAEVSSYDFDPRSVACTRRLREIYFPDDSGWSIGEGSVLDEDFMSNFRGYDVVYSWGVLHHTGRMWDAVAAACDCVGEDGILAIALYNDQGAMSRRWLKLKRIYNRLPGFLRFPYTILVMGTRELREFFWFAIKFRPLQYFERYRPSNVPRGMSYWHDLVDWIGGYPFEVAGPDQVFRFVTRRGFRLMDMHTCCAGLGCNEYVFKRLTGPANAA